MILGIAGLMGSGKDTVADYLVSKYGFKRESWAGTLKDAVASVFGWDRELLEGRTEYSRKWRETVDEWWANRLDMPDLTPRMILQEWGTEVCRNNFHNDIWIASMEYKLNKTHDNIVISDCRFENELESIKSNNGVTVRVVRGKEPDWVALAKTNLVRFRKKYPDIHASEFSSVNLEVDYIINNDGSLDDLYEKIDDLLQYHRFSK